MTPSKILWVDCLGAAPAGLDMLMLSAWLSRLYALLVELVIGLGVVNLVYGGFSFSLAVRRKRPRALITLLVVANATWAFICLVAAAVLANQASTFGIAHLIIEGIYERRAGALGMEPPRATRHGILIDKQNWST